MVELLDTRVQRPSVFAERNREKEFLLGRIAQQERSLRLAIKQPLRLVAVHFAPVKGAAGYLLQIRHQTVDVINLRGRHYILKLVSIVVIERMIFDWHTVYLRMDTWNVFGML